MPAEKTWIVTASGDRPLQDLVKELREHGFVVHDILDAIGIVTGFGSASLASRLRKVRGVADVAPETSVDLGPPGQGETW